MDSFIRSKYESHRWAMEGPPPEDPSVLDSGVAAPVAPPTSLAPQQMQQSAQPRQSESSTTRSSVTSRQPQPHQLLSATLVHRSVPSQAVQPRTAPAIQPQPQPASAVNDLFSLDFHPPTPSSTTQPPSAPVAPSQKDIKQDILSLYSDRKSVV